MNLSQLCISSVARTLPAESDMFHHRDALEGPGCTGGTAWSGSAPSGAIDRDRVVRHPNAGRGGDWSDVTDRDAMAVPIGAIQETLLAHERLARDLKIAEQVQHRFLPQSLPEVSDYEFFAYYHAAYEVGGDYYDFVPLADHRLGIALGDVSGKGVAAALLMAKFSGETRFHVQEAGSPSAAAATLNRAICDAGIDERYITLSLTILDVTTGRLQLCSAGHPPLLLRRSNGIVEELGKNLGGFPLGIMPDAPYDHVETELGPGDVVVVYSDGVTDARNPMEELYDIPQNRRLLNCIRRMTGGPEAVGNAIIQEIHDFSRGHVQADDITLVCFGPAGR